MAAVGDARFLGRRGQRPTAEGDAESGPTEVIDRGNSVKRRRMDPKPVMFLVHGNPVTSPASDLRD